MTSLRLALWIAWSGFLHGLGRIVGTVAALAYFPLRSLVRMVARDVRRWRG